MLVNPCCCAPTCPVNFSVDGCRSTKLAGATCSIWTDSSKTTFVGSAVTNSVGVATVMVSAAGTYYREISHPRFVTSTGAFTVSSCPTGTTLGLITLAVATGFHCIPSGTACATPAPDVIYFTSYLGSATLTYDAAAPGGAGWTGTITRTYSGGCGASCDTPPYPGGGLWPAPYDFSVLVIFRGTLTIQYQSFRCPDITAYGVPNGCPVPDGHPTTFRQVTNGGTTVTSAVCPPVLAVGGNITWGTQVAPCGAFYTPCAVPTPGTWSLTE